MRAMQRAGFAVRHLTAAWFRSQRCLTRLALSAALTGCSAGAPDSRPDNLGNLPTNVANLDAGTGTAAVGGGPVIDNAPPPTAAAAGVAAPAPTGTNKPNTNLDPNLVFDWQDTPPGSSQASNCRPGVYTGKFDCEFIPNGSMTDGGPPGFMLDVSGPVSIELSESANGEFLEISQGQLSAVAEGFFGFKAQLQGNLDCKTLQLAAMAQNGMWALGDPDMPLLPGGTFGANIDGKLDATTGTIAGQWSFTTGTIPGTCTGTWSAEYMP